MSAAKKPWLVRLALRVFGFPQPWTDPPQFRVATNGREYRVEVLLDDGNWSLCRPALGPAYFDDPITAREFRRQCEKQAARDYLPWDSAIEDSERMVCVPQHYAENVLAAAAALEEADNLIDRREGEVLRKLGNLMKGGKS